MALLAKSIEAGADDAEIFSAFEGSERSGDFLLDLGHANGALTQVVRKRDGRVVHEQQHGIGMLAHAAQEIEWNGLLDAATLAGRLVHLGMKKLTGAQGGVRDFV